MMKLTPVAVVVISAAIQFAPRCNDSPDGRSRRESRFLRNEFRLARDGHRFQRRAGRPATGGQ